MSNTLDENLNIIAENSNLEIELLDGDLNIIAKLDDEPNDVGGMTAAELKAEFDKSGLIIQKYINEKLVPAILAEDATEAARKAAENTRVSNENQRIENENARVAAEQARADENTGIVARATQKANEAEESARLAAQAMLGQIPDGTFPESKLVAELRAAIDRAKSGGDIDAALAGKITAYLGTIEGDISQLDNATNPGHLSFLDTYGALGHTGALYDVEVSKTNYNGVDAVTQTATRTYPNNLDAKFERTYYVVGGWSAWKQLATTDYAVAQDGSTPMTGTLIISKSGGAAVDVIDTSTTRRSRYQQTSSSICNLLNYLDSDNWAGVQVFSESTVLSDILKLHVRKNGTAVTYKILHTGNKPSGSYTGNGDATARSITHGGTGVFVAIYSENSFMLLSPQGGFGQAGTTAVHLTSAGTSRSGYFTLATDDPALNANGVTYYYQVL